MSTFRDLKRIRIGACALDHTIEYEWINEIPTVPIYCLANPQPREWAWNNQRGKKTLLSLTLVRLCEMTYEV